MSNKIRDLFLALLSEDMEKQARRVEALAIFVFIVLLAAAWAIWQFKFRLSATAGELNIFQLFLSKK